jgi:hypothetical protein
MTELEALCCYYASAAKRVDVLVDMGKGDPQTRKEISLNCDYMDDALDRIRKLMEPRIPEWLAYEKAKREVKAS